MPARGILSRVLILRWRRWLAALPPASGMPRDWDRAPRAQRLMLEAFAHEPSQPPFGTAYRPRHNLPGTSTIQRAIEALAVDELIERHGAGYRIAEPFLAEWIVRTEV